VDCHSGLALASLLRASLTEMFSFLAKARAAFQESAMPLFEVALRLMVLITRARASSLHGDLAC